MTSKVPPDKEEGVQRSLLLRRYRRLWIAQQDLEEAQATIRQILKLRLRRFRRKSGYNPLLTALNVAVLVSYARAFVNTRGESVLAEKTLPGSILRKYSAAERDLHDYILRMRNQEIAHSDPEFLQLQLQLFDGGDGGVWRIPREPLDRWSLRRLDRMIQTLDQQIQLLCTELRVHLPWHEWL